MDAMRNADTLLKSMQSIHDDCVNESNDLSQKMESYEIQEYNLTGKFQPSCLCDLHMVGRSGFIGHVQVMLVSSKV